MPSEAIKLMIGSEVHADWESFEVDSDYLTPADAWHVARGPGTTKQEI